MAAIRAKKAILIQVNRLARKRDKNRPQVTRNRPFRVSISQVPLTLPTPGAWTVAFTNEPPIHAPCPCVLRRPRC